MDALLAESFQQLGGELRSNSRWTSNEYGEGTVCAIGRRARSAENGTHWFGLKAHVGNLSQVNIEADLEMHISPGGYVGVNRINDNEINVCGLFRARAGHRQPESKLERLRGEAGSLLRERLSKAQFDENSFCSVAGISLKPQRAATKQECCIGDALMMTPPVTGNGMSMAFESAEMAIEPLTAYSCGSLTWQQTQRQIAFHCDAVFSRRLAWARVLQWMMISPVFQSWLGKILLRSDWLWQLMFAETR